MEKLLMLGTAKGTKEILEEAKKRGYYTIVTDYDEPSNSKGKLISDTYWMYSTSDYDVLEQKCREEKVTGIINGISTFNISTTMELTRRLNKPCYCSKESWHYTINKRDFKDICKKNNVPVATDYYISDYPQKEELDNIVCSIHDSRIFIGLSDVSFIPIRFKFDQEPASSSLLNSSINNSL